MRFNQHSDLVGKHAFLSASSSHWVNYDSDKMENVFRQKQAAIRGTQLHDFAQQAIKLGVRMSRVPKTINDYINDGIGYRMTPEQSLFYSINCFGTADTVSFRDESSHELPVLRIHDLKTGVIPGKPTQLEVYTALFCLEYGFKPHEIYTELRIYQSDDIVIWNPPLENIVHIMDRIVTFDRKINELRMGDLS